MVGGMQPVWMAFTQTQASKAPAAPIMWPVMLFDELIARPLRAWSPKTASMAIDS